MATRTRCGILGATILATILLMGVGNALAGNPLAAQSTPTPTGQPGLPLTQFYTDDFAGAGACTSCHGGLKDAGGNDISPETHWRSTAMANAAKDPFWQAVVSSEAWRAPTQRGVIEEKCATCHTPMAYTQAELAGEPQLLLGEEGFLHSAHPLNAPAMDGVSCTLCHQIAATGLGQPASFSGHYPIDTGTDWPDRLLYGPYTNPNQNVMPFAVGYMPVFGEHVRAQAGLCGACHTLFTPILDGEGVVQGEFPEQALYLEWEHSGYSASERPCQSCHLPELSEPIVISRQPPRLPAHSPYGLHHLVGGNIFLMDLLRANSAELRLTASSAQIEATRGRALALLQQQAASISLEGLRVSDGRLAFEVLVQNKAGHKLPSGFPSRRAWLHVTVTDAADNVRFESGRPLPDGRIAGCDADANPTKLELHYAVIQSPDQVQVYEAAMHDTNGALTYTLMRGAGYAKDNRLLPVGFDKDSASAHVAVHGAAASDPDFLGGADRVAFDLPADFAGPLTVQAELWYQSLGYRFAQDLSSSETAEVARLTGYLEDFPPAAVLLASAHGRAGAGGARLPLLRKG